MKSAAAQSIMEYSFLVAFAKDGHLHHDALMMIERLVEKGGEIDDEERVVLRNVFAHAERNGMSESTAAEVAEFRQQYGI